MYGKISVIIPVFRTERYLEKCITSVIEQTYRNLEIILIDDGSDDNCGNICDLFCRRDERIRVIHRENGGLSRARNSGLEVCSGDFIAFVDSDDFTDNDMYAYLIENIGNSDIAVCSYYTDSEGSSKKNITVKEKTVLSGYEATKELFLDERIKNHVWNKLFRKRLFDGVTFPGGKTFEDILTTYRLFEKAESVVLLPECKYHYLVRQGAISKGADSGTCFSRFEAHLTRFNKIKDSYPECTGVLLRQLFISARSYAFSAANGGENERERINLIKRFFSDNEKIIAEADEFNTLEKKQAYCLKDWSISKIKKLDLLRKAGRALGKY